MINNDAQLDQARRVLSDTEAALGALRRRVAAANPSLFQAMSESYVNDILRLRSQIDGYVGTAMALDARAPLWLSLEGAGLTGADVSTRLLAEWLDKMRKAVVNVTEFLQTGRIRSTGRPTAELLAITDLHLVALAEGSVRIGFRLPPMYRQEEVFPEAEAPTATPRRAIERLLEMALWAQSDDSTPPFAAFPDTDEATVVADHLSSLVPSLRGNVRAVSFSGALTPSESKVTLVPSARPRLRGLIHILSSVTEEIITGTIREIDLDAQRVILRERGEGVPDMRCSVPDDLMPVVEHLLDRTVRVRGLVSSATPYAIDVAAIEPAPPPEDASGGGAL